MAVHVRYNSWYISLPCSAKQQREITKFCVVKETVNHNGEIFYFYFKCFALSEVQFRDDFDVKKQRKMTFKYCEIRR